MARNDIQLLRGAVDMHMHSSPDLFPRSIDSVDLVRQARDAGMRAIVLKCHFTMTAFRAKLLQKDISEGFDVFGGLALNHSVGGLNPHAVDVAIKAGCKIIWMPTISSQAHLKFYGVADFAAMKVAGNPLLATEGISPITNGELAPTVEQILGLIADSDVVLATGHISPAESKVLVKEAKNCGVKKIIVTHPEFEVVNMSISDQIELAREGAYLERNLLPLTPMWRTIDIDSFVKIIREAGVEHSVLSTDLGQINNPLPVDGYRMLIQMLLEKGLQPREIEIMAKTNPRKLLGLDHDD